MSETTRHGENIANEIQSEDAYGYFNLLTYADIWHIIDNIHSHYCDDNYYPEPKYEITRLLEKWMRDLEDIDEDLPL